MFISKDETIADDLNMLSALFALPTVRGMQSMGMDAVETAEFMNRLRDKGEALPCFRLIQFLVTATGHKNAAMLDIISDSPESIVSVKLCPPCRY